MVKGDNQCRHTAQKVNGVEMVFLLNCHADSRFLCKFNDWNMDGVNFTDFHGFFF